MFNPTAVTVATQLCEHTCSSSGPALAWSLLISVWWMLREVETLELNVSSAKICGRGHDEDALGRTGTPVILRSKRHPEGLPSSCQTEY